MSDLLLEDIEILEKLITYGENNAMKGNKFIISDFQRISKFNNERLIKALRTLRRITNSFLENNGKESN